MFPVCLGWPQPPYHLCPQIPITGIKSPGENSDQEGEIRLIRVGVSWGVAGTDCQFEGGGAGRGSGCRGVRCRPLPTLHIRSLTPTVAEPPEQMLLAGRHGDVVQHAEPGQAVNGEASVVGQQGQRVSLQHQQPQALEGAEAGGHALQVRQVIEAQVQRDEVGPRRGTGLSRSQKWGEQRDSDRQPLSCPWAALLNTPQQPVSGTDRRPALRAGRSLTPPSPQKSAALDSS